MSTYRVVSIEKTTKEEVVLMEGIGSIHAALEYMNAMKKSLVFNNDDLGIFYDE